MSGTPFNDSTRHPGHPPHRFDAEFEDDLQCALTNMSPVLITAPREIAVAAASRIHRHGLNPHATFLTIDCASARPEQFEMVFETASPRGTVFLRDIDRLAPALQSDLFFRIVPLGVRVIAATTVSLLCAAVEGAFDERLFYRLNQIHLVATPPPAQGRA